MKKILYALLLCCCHLFLASCQQKFDLAKAEQVSFFVQRGAELLELTPKQELKQELLEKLSRLHQIEAEISQPGMTVTFLPAYSYDFVCMVGKEVRAYSFFVRNRTWLGNSTLYQFDAKKYFAPSAWHQVDASFRGRLEVEGDKEYLKPEPENIL